MFPKIPVILGPTSSGKTSLALALCRDIKAEIISVDSRQVFKHMDIGTGKLPINSEVSVEKHNKYWVLNGVNIWGYDMVSPGDYFSAVDMRDFVFSTIKDIRSRGVMPIIVGGTGFYLAVLTGEISPDPKQTNVELRKELNSSDLPILLEKLETLAPSVYSSIDKNNKVRVVRALEKSMLPMSHEPRSHSEHKYDFVTLGLTGSRELLYSRADSWTVEVWNKGLVGEVTDLLKMGYAETPQIQGIVYKTVVEHLNNETKEHAAIQRIQYDLHAYIRRQQTWFQKYAPKTLWFDISRDSLYETVYNFMVKEFK